LPHEIFSGTTTSIFIFRSGIPQNNNKIFACAILEDGLETIKNQGRQDIKSKWEEIERYWVDVIYKQSGDNSIQWLDPKDNLRYKVQDKPFTISEQNFKKIVLDYIFFKSSINPIDLKNKVLDYVLYDNVETVNEPLIEIIRSKITAKINPNVIDIKKWHRFIICGKGGIFKLIQPKARKLTEYLNDGEVPFVASGAFNNGIEKYVETDEILDKGNCITVSAIGGFSFYQEKDFIGRGGAGSAIKILYSDKLNEKNALFICAVLQQILKKYDYTTMLSGDKLKKEFIYLPSKKDGQPDFEFMANYIEILQKQLKMWV
jgi:hypothetical protein